MGKFLYPIYKLKLPNYKRWWLYYKSSGGSGVLSDLIEGDYLVLNNSLPKGFNLLQLVGNTIQDGEPSPENEVSISNVTGKVNTKIQNKNLFSSIWEQGALNAQGEPIANNKAIRTKDYIKVKPNTEYYISRTIASAYMTYRFYDKNYNFLGVQSTTNMVTSNLPTKNMQANNFSQVITINNVDVVYMKISDISNDLSTKYLLQYNSSDTSYVPHQEQNLLLTLGDIELCKIDTAKDYFFKNVVGSKYYNAELLENKWYLHKEIGKVVLNGSENWTTVWNETNRHGYRTNLINALYPTNPGNFLEVFSNYYKAYIQNTLYRDNTFTYGMCIRANYSQIIIKNNDLTTLSDFVSWLSTHNLVLYYQLATPTDIEITETTLIEQLEEFSKAKSYEGQTIIYGESDGSKPNYKVKYYMKGE